VYIHCDKLGGNEGEVRKFRDPVSETGTRMGLRVLEQNRDVFSKGSEISTDEKKVRKTFEIH
jgi:hypothetical protein